MEIKLTKKIAIYGSVSLFLLILVFLSVDYERNVLSILMHLMLGIFLTQWYIILGYLGPDLQKRVWERTGKTWEDYDNEFHDGFLSWKYVLLVMLGFTLFLLLTLWSITPNLIFVDYLVVILYVTMPSLYLLYRRWHTLFISVLWVWFPIEWGLVGDHIGELRFEILPADALIGLFALLWPMIMLGRHLPWYSWNIRKSDLKYVNISTIGVTIAVVPLGMFMYFLKFSLDAFVENTDYDNPVILAIIVFMAIFVVQGLMEETLFRGIIFKHWYYQLKKESNKNLGRASILGGGFLIVSIPFWDTILDRLASLMPLPIFEDMASRVGSLERALGEYEGAAIPIFEGIPVWPFYLGVALLLTIGGLIFYEKYPQPMVAALIASSMIFGFAHFQDWRYVLFATFAGIGYGYTYFKTKNIAAAAMVHMGVDAVWSLFLSY